MGQENMQTWKTKIDQILLVYFLQIIINSLKELYAIDEIHFFSALRNKTYKKQHPIYKKKRVVSMLTHVLNCWSMSEDG